MPKSEKEYFEEYRKTHPKEIQINNHNYYFNHREERLRKNCECNKRMIKQRRNELLQLLGGKCANPYNIDHSSFEKDPDYVHCLQVDHVNGGGVREKRNYKQRYGFYKMIIEKIKAGSKDYQLLCANCNWIKRYKNKECEKVS